MDAVRDGLLRAQSFFDAIAYPPTRIELISAWDGGSRPSVAPTLSELDAELSVLIKNELTELRGRMVFRRRESLIAEHEMRERLFARKIRRARKVASWLARISGVRFIALCNTTALAHADEDGDLDFFVVTRRDSLWQTRGWATLPFQLGGSRPRADRTVRDAVCLSFFVDDAALDLSSLQIEGDVYFRHWFLSLLPLFDDGVSVDLWRANRSITDRHPLATPWIVHPELRVTHHAFRIPSVQLLEPTARRLQEKRFSSAIRSAMNRDTRVVVNEHVLKFHVEDGREKFRDLYRANCRKYGIAS